MNELTEGGPVSEAISRRYGVQGRAIATLASDLFPVVEASDRGADEELYSLAIGRRGIGQGTAGVVAAEYAAVGLANPSSSGAIAVIEELGFFRAAGAAYVTAQAAAVEAETSNAGYTLDARYRTERTSLVTLTAHRAADTDYGDILAVRRCDGVLFNSFELPYVLAPLSTLWIVAADVAESVSAYFRWRQRRLGTWESTP